MSIKLKNIKDFFEYNLFLLINLSAPVIEPIGEEQEFLYRKLLEIYND